MDIVNSACEFKKLGGGKEKFQGDLQLWCNIPDVTVFLNGILLKEVTELLSADKWTGSGNVGVSECERSCIARPPCPTLDIPVNY